jgi:hypothetical protein
LTFQSHEGGELIQRLDLRASAAGCVEPFGVVPDDQEFFQLFRLKGQPLFFVF